MSWTMQNEAEGLNLDGSASFQASLLQYFFFIYFFFLQIPILILLLQLVVIFQ